MSGSRFPPTRELRKTVAALYRNGYPMVARSILQGVSRIILVDEDTDWQLFQHQMATHNRAAWFGTDMDAFLDDEELYCTVISYRHVDYRIRHPRGATLNAQQWARLRVELLDTVRRVRTNRITLWLDQVLHCSGSLTTGTSWVSKGVLPYIALPVLYIGGPDEADDEACKNRLWPSVERYCALTSGGISMRGRMNEKKAIVGGDLRLTQSLFWIAGRIIAGTFNSCELSWVEDYLDFREMSLKILMSEKPVESIDNFIREKDDSGKPRKMITVSEAFDLSKDSNLLLSSGQRRPFLGTYLGGKVTSAQTDDSSWHGIREWVQYRWHDGKLRDETDLDLDRIRRTTHWGLFMDPQRKRHAYALGVVSESGEMQAMGVAHVRDITPDGHGTVLWFQRGVSSQSYSYSRFVCIGKMPYEGVVKGIAEHWGLSIGDGIALQRGNQLRWKWSSA